MSLVVGTFFQRRIVSFSFPKLARRLPSDLSAPCQPIPHRGDEALRSGRADSQPGVYPGIFGVCRAYSRLKEIRFEFLRVLFLSQRTLTSATTADETLPNIFIVVGRIAGKLWDHRDTCAAAVKNGCRALSNGTTWAIGRGNDAFEIRLDSVCCSQYLLQLWPRWSILR